MGDSSLDFVFHPASVAIIGASENTSALSSSFVQHFIRYGFKGNVYPINPKRPSIHGFKAYPDVKSIPGKVDYVIDCIALSNTPELLAECHLKGARVVHLFAGRASETGRKEAIELEQTVLNLARGYGIRLIGPNCLGIYYPKEGLSMGWDFPKEAGSVGAALQSGGLSQTLIRVGALRGLRFSKVVSYGNALDLNECDFLDYLSQDPETQVVLCYLEGVKDAKRYFRTLRNAAKLKPVILLKGGRTKAGNAAAASHTAALAGSSDIWATMIQQAGAVLARDFENWIDLGVAFSMMRPIKGFRVGIAGGGGGHGVLNADECEEEGFHIVSLPREIREQIRQKAPLIWDWISNPVDMSIMRDTGISNAEVLTMMSVHPDFDFLIGQITEDIPSGAGDFTQKTLGELEGYLQIFHSGLKPLAVVLGERGLATTDMDDWRWKLFAEVRARLVGVKVPFFPTVGRAARVIKAQIHFYQKER